VEGIEGCTLDVSQIIDDSAVGPVERRLRIVLQMIFCQEAVETAETVALGGELAIVKAAPAVRFRLLYNACPYWIQFDIGAAPLDTIAGFQQCVLETCAPKVAGAIVGFVVPARKGLLEGSAEFRDVFELFSGFENFLGADIPLPRVFSLAALLFLSINV